jgi:hypothetical protein
MLRDTLPPPEMAVITRPLTNYVHVTAEDSVASIRRHGILLRPPRRTYTEGVLETIGGIYVGTRMDGIIRTIGHEVRMRDRHATLALFELLILPGTRFCLDEDEVWSIDVRQQRDWKKNYPGISPDALATAANAHTEARLTYAHGDDYADDDPRRASILRQTLNEWSCRLAGMLDQNENFTLSLRLFDPPIIRAIYIEPEPGNWETADPEFIKVLL